jgi:hypothetical protein
MKNADPQGIPLLGKAAVDATSKKYREASFDGADGVVRSSYRLSDVERTTPSAPAEEASRHFYYWRSHPSFATHLSKLAFRTGKERDEGGPILYEICSAPTLRSDRR